MAGLVVKAIDVDLLSEDDFLGQGETASDGSFTILYRQEQFVKNVLESFTEGGPDIVLTIYRRIWKAFTYYKKKGRRCTVREVSNFPRFRRITKFRRLNTDLSSQV